jgi:hypothetical protein
MPQFRIHNPTNGIFDWNGQDCPHGEFRVTHVGSYLITYFQPFEAGVRGSVQVHYGRDIQFAWTVRAREVAERFAEMVARRDGGDGYVLLADEFEAFLTVR